MEKGGKKISPGPFRADQIKEGDRYELSDGHPVLCLPSGGDHAVNIVVGGQVLNSDPDVDAVGSDAGFTPRAEVLRAPDLAVGNVPDKPGWIPGVPTLAVEYASVGQDEKTLQEKIVDLLDHGTRWVWVVRLIGPRRVEVYEKGKGVRAVGPGEALEAPGVLRNPVPIEGLFDRSVANELTLRNLLQRKGYGGIEEVREEARGQDLQKARDRIRATLATRGLTLEAQHQARIDASTDLDELLTWLTRAVTAPSVADVF